MDHPGFVILTATDIGTTLWALSVGADQELDHIDSRYVDLPERAMVTRPYVQAGQSYSLLAVVAAARRRSMN